MYRLASDAVRCAGATFRDAKGDLRVEEVAGLAYWEACSLHSWRVGRRGIEHLCLHSGVHLGFAKGSKVGSVVWAG